MNSLFFIQALLHDNPYGGDKVGSCILLTPGKHITKRMVTRLRRNFDVKCAEVGKKKLEWAGLIKVIQSGRSTVIFKCTPSRLQQEQLCDFGV